MSSEVLQFGFEYDKKLFLDFTNRFQITLSILSALTIHPAVFYFLIFKSQSMSRDIKIGYIWNTISIVLNEWYFSIAFRPYFIFPYDAIYCDGPICRLGLPKRLLITLFVFFIILEILPFTFLMLRLHQSFIRMSNKTQLSMRQQIALYSAIVLVLTMIVAAWAIFARDCDNAAELMQDPEIAWLLQRGGIVFMFGSPGNAQYFKSALISIGVAVVILGPVMFTLMTQSIAMINKVRNIRLARHTDQMSRRMFAVLSSQMFNTTFVFLFPILILCLFTFIDTSFIPGVVFAPMRSSILLLFCLNPAQTSIVYLLKNPIHRKYAQELRISIWRKIRAIFECSEKEQSIQNMICHSESSFTTGAWAC